MTTSRKEYMTDLLEDCDAVLHEIYGDDMDNKFKEQLMAALILADAINGLRKSLLTVQGGVK